MSYSARSPSPARFIEVGRGHFQDERCEMSARDGQLAIAIAANANLTVLNGRFHTSHRGNAQCSFWMGGGAGALVIVGNSARG